jgi:plastocyanin
MRKWPILLLTAIAVVTLACGDSGTSEEEESTAAESASLEVNLVIASFTHPVETVEVGMTVIWTNQDTTGQHTVTHRPDNTDDTIEFDSGGTDPNRSDPTGQAVRLRRGQTFQHTFDQVGTFPYICLVHPVNMKGTITVVAKSGS